MLGWIKQHASHQDLPCCNMASQDLVTCMVAITGTVTGFKIRAACYKTMQAIDQTRQRLFTLAMVQPVMA